MLTAVVLWYKNYYPFGMTMPGRNANPSSYRHGFNGMEKDDELKGEGNSYDFGARVYDSRLGRFLSIDPKSNNYPANSPFLFAGNKPIVAVDRKGEDEYWAIMVSYNNSTKRVIMIRIVKEGDDEFYVGRNPSGTIAEDYLIGLGKDSELRTKALANNQFKKVENPIAPIKEAVEDIPLGNRSTLNRTFYTGLKVFYDTDEHLFDPGAMLSDENARKMDLIINDLKNDLSLTVTVTGYASNKDSEEYNIELSRKRAQGIKDSMLKDLRTSDPDFDADRIIIDAKGAENPEESESDEPEARKATIIPNY